MARLAFFKCINLLGSNSSKNELCKNELIANYCKILTKATHNSVNN